MSWRIGWPCPISDPNVMSPVSACASKWMTLTRPQPRARATAVAFGQVTVWSPPRISGIAPLGATVVDGGLEVAARALGVAGEHLDVAGVEHPQVLQPVDAQRERGPRAVVRQVVGAADRLRAEPRARAVRRTAVEGCAHDHDVGARVGLGLVDRAAVDPEEGDVGTEHGAVARHRVPLPRVVRRRPRS